MAILLSKQLSALNALFAMSGVTQSYKSPRVEAGAKFIKGALFLLMLALFPLFASPAQAQTFGCSPAMANDIVCENSKTGNPASQWDVSSEDAGDPSIQGFATDISVAQGGTISFKVKSTASAYTMSIYRMGYYAGNGARLIATITPSVTLPQTQPACKTDAATDLYDCGTWAVSASWTVPSNATSGIYFVHLVRTDTGGDSHIVFVVRNDSSHSNILFQTSDEAWQAYNDWGGTTGVLGGHTLYGGPGEGNWTATDRAYKVSYNRPFDTRSFESATWVFNAEYPMIRFLESNGYDVTYFTHVDGIRNSSLITNHKIYMSTGHDEYWTAPLRANIEAARDAGVNLAFFSGNEVFWKTRWENSTDGSNTPYRTLVCYKETYPEAQIDPDDPPTWTGTWRDPTFSPPSDGGRPENAFTGTLFMVNGPGSDNNGLQIKVPSADGKMRFWRNTSEASLAVNTTATLPMGTLGYEWDTDPDNGFRPAGTFDLSTATYTLTGDLLLDYGVTYGGGPATHHMTLHRAASGALVFGAGTVQWAWGLDKNHDNNFGFTTPAASKDMQQATINLFADMGVQPAAIQGGLLLATQSTDAVPPVSTITSPTSGSSLGLNVSATVSGTASDSGGGVVGGVEVSVDGGQTWHPATGRATWTYSFTTPASPTVLTIKSRAVDDSGNIETPGAGVSVTAGTVVTFSISGTISPTAAGSGATVKLTGTSAATVTANSSGAYTFSGLVAGNYTVTPTHTGYTFNPVSTAVTVSTANVTAINFAGTQSSGTTFSISGSVTPLPNGVGVTIALTGTATASALTDASGNFTIAGLSNGSYTVTPTKPGFAFSPAQASTTVASANVTGILFTATPTSETLFTTQAPLSVNQTDGAGVNYELGTLVQSNTTGQITGIRFWKDSKETGTHTGNIWSAAGALLTSVTFANETASGWQQQALVTPLSITANTTYVVSVNTGATYYVTSASGLAAQIVNLNLSSVVGNNGVYGSPATFPTNSWETSNYFRDVVFVPGVTYSVTGTITPSATGTGSTVTLSLGSATVATTTADATGKYTFTGLANSNYTVTPVKSGFTFTPASAAAVVSNGNVTITPFTIAAIPTYSVTGTITPSATGAGSTVTLAVGGSTVATTTADGTGTYSFTGLTNNGYTVTPAKSGFTFSPTSALATVTNASMTVPAFTITAVPTYSISGTVTPAATGTGSTITLSSGGTTVATTTVGSTGSYSFTGMANGNYTITPTKAGSTFSPATAPANVSNANVTVTNFTIAAAPISIDVTTSTDRSGVAKTIVSPAFTTTATSELLLAFVSTDASGTGTNVSVSGVTGGSLTWALVERTNTQRGTAEIWRAFATTTLSGATVTATLSQSVSASLSVMSFKGVSTTGTGGSGAIGAVGTSNAAAGAPTASLVTTMANSVVIGVGDDWDNAASRTAGPNQTVVHQFLSTTGDTYWVQMVTTLAPAGTTVKVNDTAPTGDRYNMAICEILP